ncbi:hypothetical protein [Planococcus lenghuensis]|uniref:Uncharacterized protein n=1 Tax=Planococcus lenghuensis TaxID=2213202 RepID=A0A1Q2KW48_9BACL|nr:hypothetical protein [Planococcus lenghuensis]AQQ52346.1 hypothetical protein B0X71_03950 [Planococcus lenghuensis]
MEWSYWKIVCKYGHVGIRKEVSVARHLQLPAHCTLLDACKVAGEMPGVKNNGVFSGRQISLEEFLQGHREEAENLYLQKLKSHRNATA